MSINLYLSDIHLGNPFFSDQNKKDLISLLNDLKYDRLYLVGDIIDIWESPLYKIKNKYHDIIKLINNLSYKKQVFLLKGNHDPEIKQLGEIFKYCRILNEYEDTYKIIVHGDCFDYLMVNYSNTIKILNNFKKIFNIFGLDIGFVTKKVLSSVSQKQREKYFYDLILEIEKTAVEFYSDKIVIMGHTHIPKLVKNKYINIGDFLHNKTYVIEENREFKLEKF